MLNQFVLVGKIYQEPEIDKNNDKFINVKIEVRKMHDTIFMEDGNDILQVKVLNNEEFLCWKKGDMVGLKGRIINNENKTELFAEKVTYLSSSNNK